jgi:pimeloyl-ACP methyl ester carboxylesterase
MGQLNIFNIGTGHHKGEVNNLLVALHRDCTAIDASAMARSAGGGTWKFINDGAGSTDPGSGVRAKVASIPGNAMGMGSTRGVTSVTDQMVELFKRTKPDQVNICGHSRGAITSVRIAAKLYELSGMTKVNLFLVDPVKRMAEGTDFYNREIHSNVDQLMCVVAEDVGDKSLFKFMMLKDGRSADSGRADLPAEKFLRMPGSHGTATQVDGPIGRVTYEIARRFLKKVGAPVGANVWSSMRVCNEYFKIPARNPAFVVSSGGVARHARLINDEGKDKVMSKHSRLDRLNELGIKNRFQAHEIFVNEDHFRRFRKHFPCLADNFGEGSRIGPDNLRLKNEIVQLQSDCPQGYFLLRGLGKI